MELQGQLHVAQGHGPGHMVGGRMTSMQMQLTQQQHQVMMAQHQQQQSQMMNTHPPHHTLPNQPGPPGLVMPAAGGPFTQAQVVPGHPPHNLPGSQPQPIQPGSGQDNISRAKSLMPSMRESVANVFKTGAEAVYSNNLVDCGTKPVELDPSKFDKALEEFYSICDHMEFNLKAAMECISQGSLSQQNLPMMAVSQSKMDGSTTYPQYLSTITNQISYAKEVHDALADAAQQMLE